MRKYFFAFALFFSSVVAVAQKNPDTAFSRRLDKYMQLTRELDFEELMNYTHPKLFKLATREQLVELLKQVYDNEKMSIAFDSTSITGVSGSFRFENVLYRKIDYWMDLTVTLKDTAVVHDEEFIETLKTSFENVFPGAIVEYHQSQKKFEIKASSIMMAVKDNATTPWMFLGYQKNEDLLKMLYPQAVIDHFKLL